MNILITGGTGSFGKKFLDKILQKKNNFRKIIVFSRDEYKQHILKKRFSNNKNFEKLRFFLGDIRDKDRLNIALRDVDIVIHAAALKQVDSAEYNPTEYVKTNVIGSQNIIECSIQNDIKKVIALSTDKASSPINLYGATKLCSDKLFVAANFYSGKNIFSVVRYGNVFGSRGSVVEVFNNRKNKKIISITDKSMTRFNITLNESIDMVLWCLKNSYGGEIFVPKIKSYKILDLARAFSNDAKIKFIGVRPGEKINEELISKSESRTTIDLGKYYAILPDSKNFLKNKYKNKKKVPKNFSYTSDKNSFLSISDLKNLIKNEEIET
tara:strand:+ start:593 stop:1567 length:975 start_codon:yes stop_codon:yes gene_type:complete